MDVRRLALYYAGWLLLWLVAAFGFGWAAGRALDTEAAAHPTHIGQQ